MLKKTMLLIALASVIVITITACQESSVKEEPKTEEKKPAALTTAELLKRGEYLVTANVCDDCHSPKKMGPMGPEIIPELRLSGYTSTGHLPKVDTTEVGKGWILFAPDLTAAVGPWGVSFAANLTSDQTGIGNWSEEQFFKAIREGKSKGLDGTRPLLPPMPWQNFRNLTDDDLRSIFTYLKSTRPVDNVVPAPKSLSQLK